nr:hypothetical protein [Neobacillus sp. 179.-C4.2 HS]
MFQNANRLVVVTIFYPIIRKRFQEVGGLVDLSVLTRPLRIVFYHFEALLIIFREVMIVGKAKMIDIILQAATLHLDLL